LGAREALGVYLAGGSGGGHVASLGDAM
jgi:hypothetical protein